MMNSMKKILKVHLQIKYVIHIINSQKDLFYIYKLYRNSYILPYKQKLLYASLQTHFCQSLVLPLMFSNCDCAEVATYNSFNCSIIWKLSCISCNVGTGEKVIFPNFFIFLMADISRQCK